MTANEIMSFILQMPDELADADSKAIVTISPGPISIKVGRNDLEGIRIIQSFPDGRTIGDCLEVLDAARWWLLFFVGMAD